MRQISLFDMDVFNILTINSLNTTILFLYSMTNRLILLFPSANTLMI